MCFLFELLVHSPLSASFWHSYLPGLVVKRVGKQLDYAILSPYKFTTFIPDGPACLMAMERREMMAASMILHDLDPPFANHEAKNLPVVLASHEDVSVSDLMSWFQEVHGIQQQMKRSPATLTLRERSSLFLLGPLLLLPQAMQDLAFELFVITASGCIIGLILSLLKAFG